MKKVLILAYDFPPYISVGALRPAYWYKHLGDFDVEPIVITRQWENKYGNFLDYVSPGESKKVVYEKEEIGTIIRSPFVPNLSNRLLLKYGNKKFRLIRKIISAFYEYTQWFLFVGTKSQLYFTAKQYLCEHKVDCIIATGDPFILFRYAQILSAKFDIPWIADYRDPWSQDFAVKGWVNKYFYSSIEKKIVGKANLITTVSDFFKIQISSNVKNKEILILPNGFDSDSFKTSIDIPQSNKVLKIAFIGTILKWHPIKSFFSVVKELIVQERLSIEVNLYGINNAEEIIFILENDFQELKDYVRIHPKISNNQLAIQIAESNIMLLFNYYAYMGTKIYDYLAIRRLILFCYANDKEANELKKQYYYKLESNYDNLTPQIDIIKSTNSGVIVNDSTHLKQVLLTLFEELQQNGFISCSSVGVELYSRKIQTQKLADIIKTIK